LAQPLIQTTTGAFWITHQPMGGVAQTFDSEAAALQFVQAAATDTLNTESLRQAYVNLHGGYHGFDLTAVSQSLHQQTLKLYPATGGGMQPPAVVATPQSPASKPQAQVRPSNQKPAEDIHYKIQLEIAGQDTVLDLAGKLSISLTSTPKKRSRIPPSNKSNDKHRLEWRVNKVDNVPHSLWYEVDMADSTPMTMRLIEQFSPVADTVQQARWPTVLVPLLPLRFTDLPDNRRDKADVLNDGWVYVFLEGYLWRELQVINATGTMRDVDLGFRDGVGDKRVARGLPTNQIVVPYLLQGQAQHIELTWSRLPFTWNTLCKLGGIAADDTRFSDKDKQAAQAIPRDEALCQDWLQTVDLSSYGAGFESSTGAVGPSTPALPNVRGSFLKRWRSQPLPVVYLEDKPIKKKVIPVIYVPGIFGSRLGFPPKNPDKPNPKKEYVWDPDTRGPLVEYYAKSYWSMIFERHWNDDEISDKTARLHHVSAPIMSDYTDKGKKRILKAIKKSSHFKHLVAQAGSHANAATLLDAAYQRRAERGWFGALSDYAPLMEAIEQVADSDFTYVCYAAGQDWRNDLSKEAEKLKAEIARIQAITDYPELGIKGLHYEAGNEKAIVVSHSQGGLIARYASEVLGANRHLQGMVQLNQPSSGAPVLYRRFIFGSSRERVPPYNVPKWSNNIFSEVIGTSSYHFTQMSNLAGAYALLPTNDYRHQTTARTADWLTTAPPDLKPGDINDIYEDVYLNERVGLLCHKRYLGDSNVPRPYSEREFTRVRYQTRWGAQRQRGRRTDKLINEVEAEDLPLSSDAKLYLPEETPWHHDNMRLRPNSATPDEDLLAVAIEYRKIEKKVRQAKAFHAALGLKQHPNTYVIRSNGLETVTQVHLFLNTGFVIACPFRETEQGDGTVPLSSQEALLHQPGPPAKSAGDIITNGKVIHADICTNPVAIEQTQHAILTIMAPLRPTATQRLFVK